MFAANLSIRIGGDFIATGLATLGSRTLLAGPLSGDAAETLALRKLAADKGLFYGTTISARQIAGDPRFIDLVLQQTGMVVAENEMKWQVMNHGARGDDDYGPADTIAAFALENDLALRGHNLLWYHRTPSWFFDLDSREEIESALVERIRLLAGRYRGRCTAGTSSTNRSSPRTAGRTVCAPGFSSRCSGRTIRSRLRTAREADPAARLVVNEYDVELDTPEQEVRRTALLNLLERMRRSGTPVDAVGVQAHLSCAGGPPFSAARLRRFLAELAGLGLAIQITELDVTDEKAPADETVRDRLVADAYSRFLEPVLDEPAVKVVVTWECRVGTAGLSGERPMNRSGVPMARRRGLCLLIPI